MPASASRTCQRHRQPGPAKWRDDSRWSSTCICAARPAADRSRIAQNAPATEAPVSPSANHPQTTHGARRKRSNSAPPSACHTTQFSTTRWRSRRRTPAVTGCAASHPNASRRCQSCSRLRTCIASSASQPDSHAKGADRISASAASASSRLDNDTAAVPSIAASASQITAWNVASPGACRQYDTRLRQRQRRCARYGLKGKARMVRKDGRVALGVRPVPGSSTPIRSPGCGKPNCPFRAVSGIAIGVNPCSGA